MLWRSLRAGFSVFLIHRSAYLLLMVGALTIKVATSVLIPPSKDMIDTVSLVLMMERPEALSGPWLLLTGAIMNLWQWATATNLPAQWPISPWEVDPNIRMLLLLLRTPAISFDCATAIAMYLVAMRIKTSVMTARLTTLLWFLNPYNIYAIEFLGVPDVAAAFFSVLAVLFILTRKPALSGLALGASIALKLYAILILPLALLYLTFTQTRRLSRVSMLLLSLLGFLVYFLWALQQGLLLLRVTLVAYTPVTTPFDSIVNFTPSYRISITAFALVLLYLLAWTYLRNRRVMLTELISTPLLLYYTFTEPYPQYALWALPFLTINAIFVKKRNIVLLAIMLSLMFIWGFLTSGATPPSDIAVPLVTMPLVSSGIAVISIVYALEVVRQWFTGSQVNQE